MSDAPSERLDRRLWAGLPAVCLQEEYQSEGISWHNIDYTDNVACIHLISKKPTGLFYLLDEESK